jgi:hypothetical protein
MCFHKGHYANLYYLNIDSKRIPNAFLSLIENLASIAPKEFTTLLICSS